MKGPGILGTICCGGGGIISGGGTPSGTLPIGPIIGGPMGPKSPGNLSEMTKLQLDQINKSNKNNKSNKKVMLSYVEVKQKVEVTTLMVVEALE